MQLISFIAFVMTVFFVCFSENLACVHVGKNEDHFLFFLVIHQTWLMKGFSVKMDTFQEILQRAPKFLLILTALFRHQPTYKNLRGNAVCDQDIFDGFDLCLLLQEML